MAYNISNSYSMQFDVLFQEMLRQHGSYLMPFVRYDTVEGESKTLKQFDTGDAIIGEFALSGNTEFSPVLYDNRKVEPRMVTKSIELRQEEMVRQAFPPVEQLAASCSEACGSALDKIIINAIGGTAKTASSGDVSLPLTQYICADTTAYGNAGTTLMGQGLTTQKIAFAVAQARRKYNSADLVCVCSNVAYGQLMCDERAASSLFNRQQAMANGFMTPYAGVQAFITSEHVPVVTGHKATGGTIHTADSTTASSSGTNVELAYIYSKQQIVLATNMEFSLDAGKDPHRNFSMIYQCKGMYDAVRMQEEAVIAIEVNTTGIAIA